LEKGKTKMNKISRIWLVLAVFALLAGSFAFSARDAQAANGNFNISVYHNINGRALGLSMELPVTASVYKDGLLIANIPLEFQDRFTADLPAGTYKIMVTSAEAGALPSMTVGPVNIDAGSTVRAQAQLAGETPILNVRVHEGEADPTTFNISVYHGINGKALGLSKELPVTAAVYQGDALIAEIPLEFKDRFATNLPPGTYTIMVTSAEAGPLPSMTVGPVFIPAGVEVRAQAQLAAGKTPIVNVKIK
jgi:hypothetical protein